jgi:uncharacterized protein HemY
LAQLDARSGRIDNALAWLTLADKTTTTPTADNRPDHERTLESLLQKKPPEASLEKEYAPFPALTANLRSLLQENRDPANQDRPLVEYFHCDARHERYHENLKDIIRRYPASRLEDNIQLQLALKQNSPLLRMVELKSVADRFPHGDTQAEILYELGQACIEAEQWTEARNYFNTLVESFPHSSFAAQVRLSTPFKPQLREGKP